MTLVASQAFGLLNSTEKATILGLDQPFFQWCASAYGTHAIDHSDLDAVLGYRMSLGTVSGEDRLFGVLFQVFDTAPDGIKATIAKLCLDSGYLSQSTYEAILNGLTI